MTVPKSKTERARTQEKKKKVQDPGSPYHWTDSGFTALSVQAIRINASRPKRDYGISLGLRLNDTREVVSRLKQGLAISSFEHLCQAMEITQVQLAKTTGIALRTLARRKKDGRLAFEESERVFRLSALFDKAVGVLGSLDEARRWFKASVRALGGKSPLEYADTELGAREVEDLLGRLEHGVFS